MSDFVVECLDCGALSPYHPLNNCPRCGSSWQEARYDYAKIASGMAEQLTNRPNTMWRFRELLPIPDPNPELTLFEGGSPLIKANNLGLMLGLPDLFIKDERQGPTASFKDRQAALTVAALKEAGIDEAVVASTGNVAISYSAYAARAGIKLWAFLTSLVPAAKMREVALYGTQVVKITGSYDQAKQIAADFASQRHLFLDLGARNITNIEAMKTIAFEICEQLTERKGAPDREMSSARWRAPDWYLQSVSGGMGPLGVLKGFHELYKMGWIDRVPKLGILQVEGCAPMVHAWKQGKVEAQPVQSPNTLIATLATGNPGRTYSLLRERMLANSGGIFESVTDDEAFRSMHILAKMEGLSVEPAAAVAFAGLIKLVRSGEIHQNDLVVVNCTGHTTPIERDMLGESYSHEVNLSSRGMQENTQEGLLAALSKVAIDRFPNILIVDDNADVRRLIRRILQSQGNYKLAEATNGREAVELARQGQPNLIILDLMMPEMDGFAVLDALKADFQTADIPVIVVTAKELTPAEKHHLHGHIQSLMQKGNFMSDELLDEVRALLG